MTTEERMAEIKRVNAIIRSTSSTQLRRDMAKYLKRLEKEQRFGITKKISTNAQLKN